MTKKPRLIFLDLIRVLAIVLVVATHLVHQISRFTDYHWIKKFIPYLGIPNFFWTSFAGLGVVIFIILSGMVLEYNYGQAAINYFSFIFKRLKRIYLTYWLCLGFTMILIFSTHRFWYNFSGLMIFTGEPWSHYIIPTAWFIGLIIALYLFFPFLTVWLRRRPWLTLTILLLISIASRYFMGQASFWHRGIDSFPLSRIFEFGLGIWLMQRVQIVNLLTRINNGLKWSGWVLLSELSFPIFLMHPVLETLKILNKNHLVFSIFKYIELALALSLLVYLTEKILSQWSFRRKS